ECIKERLDAEPVARCKERTVVFVPNNQGKFAAQTMQALCPEIFVEMQSDLAIGAGLKLVAGALEFFANGFVAIKFAVDDNSGLLVLAGNGLISGREVDNAEPRVPQSDSAI